MVLGRFHGAVATKGKVLVLVIRCSLLTLFNKFPNDFILTLYPLWPVKFNLFAIWKKPIHFLHLNDSRPPSARTPASRGQRPVSARSDDRPPTARDRTPRGRQERPDSGRIEKRPLSAKRQPSLESGISGARGQRIRDFQENRSAKTIQRHWKAHRQDQQVNNS